VAHQLAVLYYSLNSGGDPFSNLKKEVENLFRNLGLKNKPDNEKILEPEKKSTLSDLTSRIIEKVLNVPRNSGGEDIENFVSSIKFLLATKRKQK
jgi:hypothetical protein